MTDVTPQPHFPVRKPSLAESIAKVGPTLFVLAVMAIGWLAVHGTNTGGQSEEELATVNEEAIPDTLTLADGKVDAAKFESVPAQVEPLANSGAISGRTIRERQTERQVVENAFRTARDQATYAANQAKVNAEAKLSEADRQLNLAWQAVETLLGYKENRETVNLNDEEALSRLEVRASFSGSVETHGCAKNERVMRGDSLIVLANTDTLYVAASIRESDWSAVSLDQNTIVSVSVPALGDRVFEARVRYFGREVQASTNSVPLVATIDNSEGLLHPGMFARMTIPIGESLEVLSVKPEAVVQHENQSFVQSRQRRIRSLWAMVSTTRPL